MKIGDIVTITLDCLYHGILGEVVEIVYELDGNICGPISVKLIEDADHPIDSKWVGKVVPFREENLELEKPYDEEFSDEPAEYSLLVSATIFTQAC